MSDPNLEQLKASSRWLERTSVHPPRRFIHRPMTRAEAVAIRKNVRAVQAQMAADIKAHQERIEKQPLGESK